MGFFNRYTKQPNKNPSQAAFIAGRLLRKFGASQMWFITTSSRQWAPQFQVLINQIGAEKTLAAVEWYVNNHPAKINLKLKSGKEFKERYAAVERLMEKDKMFAAVVSAGARLVAKMIEHYDWPKDSKKQLDQAVEITMGNYRKFRTAVVSLDRYSTFCEHVVKVLPTPSTFAQQWMVGVWQRVRGWDGWNGDLLAAAWHGNYDNRYFRMMLLEYVGNWSDDNARHLNGLLGVITRG